MSQNIDKRIVEMQFDNKQFESGIQTSVKSLDELKKGLDFDKAVKGLSGLEKAGRSFNLSGISDGVSAISDRFSAMGIVGMRVLQNLTDAAYNCGKRMLSALTIDPVKSGFAEYETQIGAIQTILANTSDAMDKAGYSDQQRLGIVNDKLDELNAYADKTIYNFTEMTNNIGRFTAAGVDLETSVSSIQGIANLAAVSGSTSQQASTAMYQLSQAISSGTVKLMDWNSVVNAGMGGELFQKALQRTASAMGVVGDEAKEAFAQLQSGQMSFRDSLSSGWLSSDILTATLSQISMDFEQIAKDNNLLMADGSADIEAAKNLMRSSLAAEGKYSSEQIEDIINLAEMATKAATEVKTLTQLFDTLKESLQSGWTQSWEYIIGDFDEAKALMTSISDYFGDIIGKSADSRNAILADWKALGGRNELINSFWNIVHSVENVAKVIKGAFAEFFPATTGKQLFDITKKISDFTAKIKAATENSELMGKVGRVFRGVAAALDIVKTAAGWAWDGLKKLLGMTEGAAGGFLDFIAGIGDWVVSLRDSIKNSETLQGILNGLGTAAASVRDLVVGGIKKIGAFFINLWEKIKATGIFTKVGDWFNSFIGKFPEFIGKIKDWGKSIVDWVKNSETLQTAWKNIKGFFDPIIKGISDFGGKLWEAIQSFFGEDTRGNETLWDKIKARFSAFGEKIGEWFETIKPKLIEAWANVKAFVVELFTKTIPNFLSNLKTQAIAKWPWLEKVFAFFEEAWAKVKAFCDPIIEKIKPIGEKLWEAIKNLFGGGKNVDTSSEDYVNFGETIRNAFGKAWLAISTFFANATKKLEGVNWGKLLRIAFGVATLVKVVKIASGLSKIGSGFSSIGKGLKNVGKALKDLTSNGISITKVMKKDSFATSLLKVAAALAILVGSVYLLSNMDAGKAWTGIGLLTIIAVELLAITFIFEKIDANGDALLKAGAAVALLTIPVYILGNLETGKAFQGIVAVGAILTELIVAVNLANKSGTTSKPAFLGLAAAVFVLSFAVEKLGNMETEKAIQGVAAVGVVLLALAGAIRLSSVAGTTSKPAFLGLAAAVFVLSFTVEKLGNIETEKAIQGVAAVGVVLLALAGAIRLSSVAGTTSKPAFLGLAAAVFVLSFAVEKLGNMETEKAIQGVAAVGVVLLALAGAIRLSSVAETTSKPAFLGLAAAVFVLSFAVEKLGNMETEKALQGVLAVGGVLLEFAGTVAIMNGMTVKWSTLIALIPAIGMIGGICYALVVLQESGVNWEETAAFCGGLSAAMLSLSGVIAIMSAIPVSGVAKGSLGLIIAAAGIGAAAAILAELVGNAVAGFSEKVFEVGSNIDGYASIVSDLNTEAINTSITAIGDLAKMAVSVGVNDYTGFYSFTSGLPMLGGRLALFSNSISKITNNSVDNAKAMVDDVGNIAVKMQELQTNNINLTLLGEALTTLGSGIELYTIACSDAESMLPENGVNVNTKSIEKMFTDLGGINIDKTVIDQVAGYAAGGGSDLTSFALGLAAIGNAIQSYKTSILGINEKDAITAGIVLAMISSLQDGLPRDGNSIINWIAGEKQTLDSFATNVVVLGDALNLFAGSLTTDTAPLSERAVSIIDTLVAIQGRMDTLGGVAAFFEGDKSLAALGAHINTLGQGFALYVSSMNDFAGKEETIAKATDIIDMLASIQVKLEETNGVSQWFTGTKSIGTFGTNLNTFGTKFSEFCSTLSGVTIPECIDDIGTVIDSFADVAVKLNGVNAYDLSDYIKWIGEDLKTFFGTAKGIGSVFVDKTNLDNIMVFVNEIADIAVKLNGVWDVDTTLIQGMLDGISRLKIPELDSDGIASAQIFLSALSETIQSDITVSNASSALSKAAVNAIRTTQNSWFSSGRYIIIGLANGITTNTSFVVNAARYAMQRAINAAKQTSGINSPSKVFAEIGMYSDKGLADGLRAYAYLAEEESRNTAQGAIHAAKSVLNNLNYMTDSIDTEPVIRPVLDLSGITNGFQTVDGLFDSKYSVNGAFFSGISSLRNGRAITGDQNGVSNRNDNREVVSELQSLSKKFEDLSTAVSNMQVILDTGVLVGQTASQMDTQLGTFASRRGRGN